MHTPMESTDVPQRVRSGPPHARLDHRIRREYGTWRGLLRVLLGQLEFAARRVDVFCQPVTGVRRLIFVCLGNINRSAFAEALAEIHGYPVLSLGLSTTDGLPATPQAQRTAHHFGVDLAPHRATGLDDYRYAAGDYLFVMEIRHARALVARGIPPEAIRLLGRWAQPMRIHLHDPHTLSDAYFMTCFTHIHSAVHNLCLELTRSGARS